MAITDLVVQCFTQSGIIAAIRCRAPLDLMIEVGDALHATPISAVMIGAGSHRPWEIITELRHRYGASMCVGAGLLSTTSQALTAIDAGAHFVMTGQFVGEIDHLCRQRQVLYAPGVRTAEEARQALATGVRTVSFFPAHHLEMMQFAAGVQAWPAPCVVAMGGVTAQNLHQYAQAGASAVIVRGVVSAATHWRMHAAIVEMRRLRAWWAAAQLEEHPPQARAKDACRYTQATHHREDHPASGGVLGDAGQRVISRRNQIDDGLHGGVDAFQRQHNKDRETKHPPLQR